MSSTPTLIAAFHRLPAVTPSVLRCLLIDDRITQYQNWTASTLVGWGIRAEDASKILSEIPNLQLDQTDQQLQMLGIRILAYNDQQYPPYVSAIASPPPLIYIRGSVGALSHPALAVVGTRRASPYGEYVTKEIVSDVARQGITIVSGLAFGIDATAHRAALSAHAPTIAVMGTGINQIYPWEHRQLAEAIIHGGGALVTEFPLGAEPKREHFPQRNRIIAGLARAVWLVEAGEKSGALITMKFGLDENRDLYVLPHDIHRPTAVGALNWLRLGATPVTSAQDFAATFPTLQPVSIPSSSTYHGATDQERAVLHVLDRIEPRHIDEISLACRLEASVIAAVLALLELRGVVRHHGDMRYTSLS